MLLVLRRLCEPSTVQIIRERYAGVGRLLGDRNQVGDRALRLHVAPPDTELGVSALKQQAVRDRRCPRALQDAQRSVPDRARLRRCGGHAGTNPWTRGGPVVTGAATLPAVLDERRAAAIHGVVEIEPRLVARGDLIRHAYGVDPPARVVPHAHALVLGPGPRRGVTGVPVCVLVLRVAVVARGARVDKEPDPVALDRPAQREVTVPILQQGRRFCESECAQLVVDVRRLAPLTRPTAEEVAAEIVAARFGDDVERGCSTVGFAEPAGDRHLDFNRIVHVVGVVRHAAAVER